MRCRKLAVPATMRLAHSQNWRDTIKYPSRPREAPHSLPGGHVFLWKQGVAIQTQWRPSRMTCVWKWPHDTQDRHAVWPSCGHRTHMGPTTATGFLLYFLWATRYYDYLTSFKFCGTRIMCGTRCIYEGFKTRHAPASTHQVAHVDLRGEHGSGVLITHGSPLSIIPSWYRCIPNRLRARFDCSSKTRSSRHHPARTAVV